MPSTPKFSFGRKHKSLSSQKNDNPTAGDYDPKFNYLQKRTPCITIKGRVVEKIDVTPGPSDYQPNPVKSKPMTRRNSSSPRTIYPFSFDSLETTKSSKQSTPGPSDYSIRSKKGPAYSFGVKLQSEKGI